MSGVWTVALKELKSLFRSTTARTFLCLFLVWCHIDFFTVEKFFARNIADARPFFAWLPIELVLLVAAITMGQWSEERKLGTVEVLLTLPLRSVELVLGKFLAGVLLVALALSLTLPIPLTVAQLGDLDWGPVVGGYLGALALATTYLSIGLCVSALTENQTASLFFTLIIGGLLYLVGTHWVTDLVSIETAEVLSAIGSGSRFENVQRGVLDLRDLFYYGSVTAFFLTLNVFFLELQRVDTGSTTGQKRLVTWLVTVSLTGVNAVAGNVWLFPVTTARWDMTQNDEYTISAVTVDTLRQLEEPLEITGFFSERTHPLLTPLVPQIRDLLAEYETYGGGNVRLDFVDPNTDEELEGEINEAYGIKSFPFAVSDRHEQSVVNSYFHILVKYGDKFEVLTFSDLIEVRSDADDIEVGLENLEYDLTRTIKRVTQEFQSLDTILAKLPEGSKVTAYITEKTLPEDFKEMPARLRTVATDAVKASNGRLSFQEVDPTTDPMLAESLYERYGVRPLAADLFGTEVFYLHLVVEAGDKVEPLMPRGDVAEGDLKRALESTFKRLVPGQLKTIGVFTEIPEPEPPNPNLPPQYQPPPKQPDYRAIQQLLTSDYQIEPVNLEDGAVPENIDVLVVGKAGAMTDKQSFALDQYLMRGGKVVALAGRYRVDTSRRGELAVAEEDDALAEMLKTYGVQVKKALVLDADNAPFPVPVRERRGPLVFERVELIPYPYFPDVRKAGLSPDHPAVSGLNNLTLPWSSPLEVAAPEGVEAQTLVSSSEDSWISETGDVSPDFKAFPETGFAKGSETGSKVLAVALTGKFPSHFAAKDSPLFEPEEGESAGEGTADRTGRTLKEALPGARLAVVGSSEMVGDLILQMMQGPAGEVHRNNLQLVQNLADWAVEDTELLKIRSGGAFARTLVPLSDSERWGWELTNYAVATLLLVLVIAIPWMRRTMVRPIAIGGAQ